jgi:ribosome-associated heat shock protein Hsp15
VALANAHENPEGCSSSQATDSGARQRLDKWLFFARVVKSRSLAARLIRDGKVRVNAVKTDAAAHSLKTGDVLTITLERRILVLKLAGCGVRRGPAVEARLLYEDLTPPPEPVRMDGPVAIDGGRPTGRERRRFAQQMDRIKGH